MEAVRPAPSLEVLEAPPPAHVEEAPRLAPETVTVATVTQSAVEQEPAPEPGEWQAVDMPSAPQAAEEEPADAAMAAEATSVQNAAPEAVTETALPISEPASAPAVINEPRTTTQAAKPERAKSLLTGKELREMSMQADLYSILVATERLEAAFIRGIVSNEDYERNCMQLIAQFKTLQTALREKCPDVRAFARDHGLKCPLAEERLLGAGLAATALLSHGTSATSGSSKESLACFKASEAFITLSDALKLGLHAVDELLPLVRDLQASISAIPGLPPLAGLEKMSGWLVTVNNMRASESLNDDQCRQLAMDVEQAYTALKTWLQEKT